jgi:hypothetical protein
MKATLWKTVMVGWAMGLAGCQFTDNLQFADARGSRPAALDFGKSALSCPQVRELRLVNRGMGELVDIEVQISPVGGVFFSEAEAQTGGLSRPLYPCAVESQDVPVSASGAGEAYVGPSPRPSDPLPLDPLCGVEAASLYPGEACRLPVRFQPERIGFYQGEITVRYRGQYGDHQLKRALRAEATERPSEPKAAIRFEDLGTPRFPGRRQANLVVHQNRLFMVGGEQTSDVWASRDGRDWQLVTDHAAFGGSRGADYHQAASFNNSLYVFALWNGERGVWRSPDGATWTKVADIGSRSSYCTISHQGKLLVIGGWKGSVSNDVIASTDGIRFAPVVSSRPFPARMDHECVSVKDRLYVIGGRNETESLRDVWMSADGRDWTKLTGDFAATPFSSSLDAVVYRDQIVILDSDRAYLSKDGGTFETVGITRRELWERGDAVVFEDRIFSLTTPEGAGRYVNRMYAGSWLESFLSSN